MRIDRRKRERRIRERRKLRKLKLDDKTEEKKTATMTVRISPSSKAALLMDAKERGWTLSQLVNSVCQRYLKNDK